MKKYLLTIFLFITFGNAIKLQPLNSTGVYFRYMGTLKVQMGLHYLWNPINISTFEQASSKYKTDSLKLFDKCAELQLNCDDKYNEAQVKIKELNDRIDKIYEVLGERRNAKFLSRRRRGWCVFVCKKKDNSGEIRDIRNTINSNFQNVQNALKKQKDMIEVLNEQNKEIKTTLQLHEGKINENTQKINELINATIILDKNIQRTEVNQKFDKLNNELFEIQTKIAELQKIIEDIQLKNYVSPQVITTDELVDYMKKNLNEDQLLYSPIYTNGPNIRKILTTFAFIEPNENIINVIIRIPLFSPDALQLYEPLTLPIISKNKVILIENYYKYCAISVDTEKYNCGKDLDSSIQTNGDFYLADDVSFPLYNSLKGDQCLINIFRETSIDKCKFKYLNENIEIFHNLGEKIVYAVRDKTKYYYECGSTNNFNNNDIVNGTGILEIPGGCSFSTDKKETVLKGSTERTKTESKDRYSFNLDEMVSEKVSNLTLPKDFIPLSEKVVLPKLYDLNEKGIYFVPEMHWFIQFLESKVFHSIVTISITLLIIAGFVSIFVYYPRYAKARNNVMIRMQKSRIGRRAIPAPEEQHFRGLYMAIQQKRQNLRRSTIR